MLNLNFLKPIISVVLVVLGIFYALPNIFGQQFVVQVSSNDASLLTGADNEQVLDILDSANINYIKTKFAHNKIIISFDTNDNQLLAKDLLDKVLTRKFTTSLNLQSAVPDVLDSLGGKALSLGLDLRGGIHFLLEVDQQTVTTQLLDANFSALRVELRKQRLYRTMKKNNKEIVITPRKVSDIDGITDIIDTDYPALVIDKARSNDAKLVFMLRPEYIDDAKRNAIKQNITTLRNRVNELGVAQPTIVQQGLERIIVQLPGVQDSARAKEILGTVATIEFRMVANDNLGTMYYFKNGTPLRLKNDIVTSGNNINDASLGIDQNGNPMVSITLDSVGGKAMLTNTKKNLGKRMAVVFIENKVETIIQGGKTVKKRTTTKDIINAARIEGTFSNRFQITGLDSTREASNLALLLRAGSLSVPIEIIEERTIGPSLGADNINQGLLSIIGGLILVFIFMLLKYGVFGLIADLVLVINLVLIVAVLSSLQATLTLPGIAGIVLTVGIAVDANVLIFERIKEEIEHHGLVKAIEMGYEKALGAIIDANITTLIAAIILFGFGTGPIKGFAVTLSIGVITSVFTAVVLSKIIVNLVYKS